MAEDQTNELEPIGVIGRPYGLKGEMRVRLFEPSSKVMETVESISVMVGETLTRFAVERVRWHRDELILFLRGRGDRSNAEELKGAKIYVPREAFPSLGSDEFYDIDLIGLDVVDATRARIGKVAGVEHPPANDVIVIELSAGAGFLDVPLIEDIVDEIDLESKTVVVDIPDGLPTRKRR